MMTIIPPLLVVLFLAVLIPMGMRLVREQVAMFVEYLRHEVEARGGTMLQVELVRWHRGPFRRKGKGQRVVKVIYRDAMGAVRQLWGRRSSFGHELIWDYDDGDSRL